ncbi:uncharacterized protein LOC133708934 [Rosa rugosa]|uniref:uncharacterized protein LOC133708934 n=1 Tax=Rosa rugosa TaxID=74645 RepID=UPI002B40BD27|nr:uncharacterized protein LOC133708934 [Rosa rugosa]XP_061990509.1 uncharacterized protein LOC133708934 [Rosa rugosa]
MRGAKSSRVFPGLGRCSGKTPVESCKVNKGVSKVEIIDLDDDDDVIDIDDIEQPQSRGSSTLRQNREFSTVIDIDDDDDASSDTDTVISVEEVGDLDSDATSSKSWFPTSNYRRSSLRSDGDECEVVQEKGFPSKGSKGKQTHSGTAPRRYGYGLYSESESASSDTDYSDCELIEGSVLHEHWKKASQKRKHVVHNCQPGPEDQASGSGSHGDTVDVENRSEQHAEAPVCSSSEHGNYEKESPPDMGTHDDHFDGSSFEAKMKTSSVESNQNVAKDSFPCAKPGSAKETESIHRNDDFQHVRGRVPEDPLSCKSQAVHNDGISGSGNEEEQSPEEHSSRSTEELAGKQSKHFMHNEQKLRDETCFSDSLPRFYNDRRSSGVLNEELSCKNQHSGEVLTDHGRVDLGGKDDDFQKGSSFEEKVKLVPGQPLNETHVDCGISEDDLGAVPRESKVSVDKSEISNEKDVSQERVGADSEVVSFCNTSSNRSSSASGNQSSEAREQLCAQGVNVTPVQNNIITDREKLKETDEYKQAMEEEMESRRQVLQIQAEEAQRLRKRKKAESMRLLDMQRRQKQRVEEVRETQKKDEENLNMKEKLRAEVRKELNRLESSCNSMASLLRGLGIQVGSGVHPLPQEVHAAYKRALLKFHPDRASRTDIRQMVEAEEKFKLISRMKEKLISTTWF